MISLQEKRLRGKMAKNIIKITESELRKMISESIEDVFGGGIDVGKELQRFLQDNKYKLMNKNLGYSEPTKRDYMIAKHFYELGKNEQED